MTNEQIKANLYRNYSRFSKFLNRSQYITAVASYIKEVDECTAQYPKLFSRDYASIDDLCNDFKVIAIW